MIDINNRTNRLYELVDGVLVEKVMSFPESTPLNLRVGMTFGFGSRA